MGLDTRQLRYFLEIAEQGSITAAARRLNVAQPALSLHLKRLEEALGTPLMVRQRTGVSATPAGRLLAERARRVLDELRRMEDDVRTLESDPSGVVRIGLPGTISALVSLPLIHAARRKYPKITLNIAEAMSGFVAGWLADDRVDLAVLYAPVEGPGFASEVLLEEDLVVLWPQREALPETVPLSRLNAVPMVLPSRGHGLRELIETRARAHDFAPKVAMEIDSYANIKTLVAEGFGHSILPAHAVAAETQAGRIGTSRIADPGLWRRAYLIQTVGRPATRAQSVIAEEMRQVVAGLIASGHWSGARGLRA